MVPSASSDFIRSLDFILSANLAANCASAFALSCIQVSQSTVCSIALRRVIVLLVFSDTDSQKFLASAEAEPRILFSPFDNLNYGAPGAGIYTPVKSIHL